MTTAEQLHQRARGARVALVEEAIDAAWEIGRGVRETLCELAAFVGSENLADD